MTAPKPKNWTEYTDDAGQLHRDDGPARTHPDGSAEWWLNDQLHRVGGPAVVRADGSAQWWQDGRLHRVGGPAVTGPQSIEFRVRGKLHREDGPALVVPGVLEAWYVFDMPHREDGPAVVHADGRTERWVAGKRIGCPD